MKNLESITIDGHVVELVAHREKGGIKLVATSGVITRERFMTLHIDKPSTPEQHLINIKTDCELLAKEVIGHKKNEGFMDDFFKE